MVNLGVPWGSLEGGIKYQLLKRLEGFRGQVLDSHFTSRDHFDGVAAQEHSHPRERENYMGL